MHTQEKLLSCNVGNMVHVASTVERENTVGLQESALRGETAV